MTPLVRSRLHAVNGEEVKVEEERDQEERREEGKEERRKQWYLSREYVLTFLEQLPKGNDDYSRRVVAGGTALSAPQVSIEEEAAHALGLDVGSQAGTRYPRGDDQRRGVEYPQSRLGEFFHEFLHDTVAGIA